MQTETNLVPQHRFPKRWRAFYYRPNSPLRKEDLTERTGIHRARSVHEYRRVPEMEPEGIDTGQVIEITRATSVNDRGNVVIGDRHVG